MKGSIDEKQLFYERFADRFDDYMSMYDTRRRIETIFDVFLEGASLEGKLLLDAACGTGWFSQVARQRGARVVSLDLGANLLRRVAEKTDAHRIQGSVLALPFKTGAFDIVVSSETIEHTPDPRGAVAELARVVAPGGQLLLTVPNWLWKPALVIASALRIREYDGYENWVSRRELTRWTRESGLELDEMRGVHLFPFVLRPTHGLLRALDKLGRPLASVMVNLCVKAHKKSRD